MRSDLTRAAVEIELGMRPPSLLVGNLTTRRALIDVRDMARARDEPVIAGDISNFQRCSD